MFGRERGREGGGINNIFNGNFFYIRINHWKKEMLMDYNGRG